MYLCIRKYPLVAVFYGYPHSIISLLYRIRIHTYTDTDTMLLNLQASSSRLVYTATRSFSSTPRALAKAPLRPTSMSIPHPGERIVELTGTEDIPTPADLFNIIGRGAEKRLAPQAESWDALNAMWVRGRAGIKDSGLGVKDRRYVIFYLRVLCESLWTGM